MSEGQAIRDLIRPPAAVMRKKKDDTTGTGGGNPVEQFPEDLSTHFMALMFHRYNYDDDAARKAHLHRTILLPVPQNLIETFNVMYNEAELGAIFGEVSDAVARGNIDSIQSGMKAVTGGQTGWAGAGNAAAGGVDMAVKAGIAGYTGGLSMLKTFISNPSITPTQGGINRMRGNELLGGAAIIAGARGGSGATTAALNRFFASAPNPHITALFKGVGLKSHNFSWKLAPRKISETYTLSKIINQLRGSVLPERGKGNVTLRFPDEVEVYIGGTDGMSDKGGGHLYYFKRAVVRNLTTNFAPDGMPSFFAKTGAPTAVNISLDLLETTIHTRGDYEKDYGGHGNGEDYIVDMIKQARDMAADKNPKVTKSRTQPSSFGDLRNL